MKLELGVTEWIILSTVFGLTWLVFVLGMAKLSKFYLDFKNFKRLLKRTSRASLLTSDRFKFLCPNR